MKIVSILILALAAVCSAQERPAHSYFAGASVDYTRGLGFKPGIVFRVGTEQASHNWLLYSEGTADTSDKKTAEGVNPATAGRLMFEFNRRLGQRWYLGAGASAGGTFTRDYTKYRQNERVAFGYLGKVFDVRFAGILPYWNPEGTKGGEFRFDYRPRSEGFWSHIIFRQKYQLLTCDVCIDEFKEHYLAGGIEYGADFRF